MDCSICNSFRGKGPIFDREADFVDKTRHHIHQVPWEEIKQSTTTCYICDALVQGALKCAAYAKIEESQISTCLLTFNYPCYEDEDRDVDKDITLRMKDGTKLEVQMFFEDTEGGTAAPDMWDHMPAFCRTVPRTDSDEAFKLIESWLTDCCSNHEMCRLPEEDPPLPTRIIDVGLYTGVVRLFETEGKSAKYLCLSHCWGLEQIITTTKATLPDRKAGIPIDLLSATFRDAVLVARRLGFEYIWIDSMCIVQDDAADWEVQSARMASIYSNAYLTIAATHAHNGLGGLFATMPDFPVQIETPDGESWTVYFRERIDHHLDLIDEVLYNGYPTITYYPLLTRAWVLQERQLSTRVLHFGKYELWMECLTDLECECGGIGYTGSGDDTAAVVRTKQLYSDALGGVAVDGEWHIVAEYYMAQVWRTVVGSYTSLGITKGFDKLPAIGGLARHMASRRKSSYFAGLWENSIQDDLLWTIRTPLGRTAREYPHTAPTWSWASVMSFVLYWDTIHFWDPDLSQHARLPYEHLSTVEGCEVTPAAIDEYGKIAKGVLRVSGLVAEGVLGREVRDYKGHQLSYFHVAFEGGQLEMLHDYLFDEPGPGHVAPGTPVYCLRMSCLHEGLYEYLVSLVLRRVGTGPDVFERIGTLLTRAKPPPVDPVGLLYRGAVQRTVSIV